MTGFKQLRDGFLEANRHKILNGFTTAIQKVAKEDAQIELQPPAGKVELGDTVSIQLIYDGELSKEQVSKFEAIVQRFSRPGA